MSLDQRVSIFTTTMRAEFQNAYEAVAEPAEFTRYTTVVPSTARIEHYTWMSPSPGLARYQGHRRYGKIDTIKYSVENKEFDASFQVLLRDIDDDQTGGYQLKPRELAERAKVFPSRWVLKGLGNAAKQSPSGATCFDGTNFFADSHTIGSGDNNLSATATDTSGSHHHTLVALFHGSVLKPVLWQNRKGPEFRTDAGSPESSKNKTVSYWIDMEGEMAFGYWWNAVYLYITGNPTVAELQTYFGTITAAFRSFTLPKSLNSDDGEYPHEQVVFSQSNLTFVGDPGLERLLQQALNQQWIPQTVGSSTVATTNLYQGFANYVVSNFLFSD